MHVSKHGFHGAYNGYGFVSRSKNPLLSVSVRRTHVAFSAAGFTGGRKPCLRQAKLPHRVGASRKLRALSWDRAQAIGALAHGFTHWATRAPNLIEYWKKLLSVENILLRYLWIIRTMRWWKLHTPIPLHDRRFVCVCTILYGDSNY